jgi:hypothetical protein
MLKKGKAQTRHIVFVSFEEKLYLALQVQDQTKPYVLDMNRLKSSTMNKS